MNRMSMVELKTQLKRAYGMKYTFHKHSMIREKCVFLYLSWMEIFIQDAGVSVEATAL